MSYVILPGDCLDVLRTIPSNLIHTCVTSPPYFGLRDYGVAGQIGIEPDPAAYVRKLVEVFREVRRVLRDDGTVWLNLGDSYATCGTRQGNSQGGLGSNRSDEHRARAYRPLCEGLKSKDLMGIPWRVAFALQADGWYLRQDIIWHKPNPMPESVRDRCTKAHEYLFLLSKNEKYYFDHEAIKEPCTSDERRPTFRGGAYVNGSTFDNSEGGKSTVVGNIRTGRAAGNKSHKYVEAYDAADAEEHRTKAGLMKIASTAYQTRNKRSVWTVSPKAFKEAHFATFPPALIEPCILAGAPADGLVLDPFGGAGTTALVTEQHGRHSISIELNPEYVAMAHTRVEKSKALPPTPLPPSPPSVSVAN